MSVTTARAAGVRRRRTRHRRSATRFVRPANPGALTVVINVGNGGDPRVATLLRSLRSLAAAVGGSVHANLPEPRHAGEQAAMSGASTAPGTLVIDDRARTLFDGDDEIVLTRKEFDLLYYLFRKADRVHTRDEIMRAVWGHLESGSRTIDIHVRRLRVKTGDRPLIATVRTVGYRLADGARIVDAHA